MRQLIILLLIVVNTVACQKKIESISQDLGSGFLAKKCKIKKFPKHFLGANLIDRPDDLDSDPSNDGQRGYGSIKSIESLQRLDDDNVKAIVLPVEFWMEDKHATQVRVGSLLNESAGQKRLRKMIQQAHNMGFNVVLVPHLRLKDRKWRGELAPQIKGRDQKEAILAFFQSYQLALLKLVEIAAKECVEMVSIGIEFKSLTANSENHSYFISLIKQIRTQYTGNLTYSSNWDEVENVSFWSDLDVIGVNAFFPLEDYNQDKLRINDHHFQSWINKAKQIHRELDTFRHRKNLSNKAIYFLEMGFQSTVNNTHEPWLWPEATKSKRYSEKHQKYAYLAHLHAFNELHFIDGIFFWAVTSDLQDYRSNYSFEGQKGFSFVGKSIEEYIKEVGSMTDT